MYLWQISLLTLVFITPVGLLLRHMTEKSIPRIHRMKWTSEAKVIFKIVKLENVFLYFLLVIEGIISNLSLFALIISIPLFFVFGL